MENNKIEQAKQILEEAGYFTDSLWQIDDVKSRYECTDDQAWHVLQGAMTNDYTMINIWETIDYYADEDKLKRKED